MTNRKRILFCVLDWGLGHATRSIPVVRQLLDRNADVFIASSGRALELLKLEFPELHTFELPSYDPAYQSTGLMSVALLRQLPKFRKVIKAEHEVVRNIVKDHSIDAVISDNRFGCWSSGTRSVFITHQVNLLMPKGFEWTSPVINSFLHSYMKKFSEVWIPDQRGELTFPFASTKVPNQRFIGWLSRFRKNENVKTRYEVIAVVSGPEPQRSIFEDILTHQLLLLGMRSLLVKGKPEYQESSVNGNLETVNHLSASELQDAIIASDVVISRSGYSTVMDMIALEKHAIFVPTPQQPEQLFLAAFLKDQRVAFAVDQDNLNVSEAIAKASSYKGLSYFKNDDRQLTTAIDNFLA